VIDTASRYLLFIQCNLCHMGLVVVELGVIIHGID